MDHLYTPWRYAFISAEKPQQCVFCQKLNMDDRDALVVHRGKQAYVCLNTFPYNNGHVMVIPNAHLASFTDLPAAVAHEMMDLTQRCEAILRSVYQPDGINMGANIGKAAGAGIADHVHMHVLPRWSGDANFMTVVAETRVLPEELGTTWERLTKAFASYCS